MDRRQIFAKMLKYNPKWFEVLMPFYDGITNRLVDDTNLELNYSNLNIESWTKCIVGEFWNFTDNYANGKNLCEFCIEYAKAFDRYYEHTQYNIYDKPKYLQSLADFNNILALFYDHVNKEHKERA